jgi:hypothetical protein
LHLSEITKQYEIGFRHSPSHFYPNSFEIERQERRLVLVAVVKRHVGKRFRVVGILKEKKRR